MSLELAGKLVIQHVLPFVLKRLQSGEWTRFGTTLVDPRTHRTLGYLQVRDHALAVADTAKVLGTSGVAIASLGTPAAPFVAPVMGAAAAGKVVFSLFDTQRTVHRIEDSLAEVAGGVSRIEERLGEHGQRLGELNHKATADLTLQLMDIGINLAGFAMTERYLDNISARIDTLDSSIRELQEVRIAEAFTRLKSLARSYDEGWRLVGSDAAEHRWRDVAKEALEFQDQFEMRARRVLEGNALAHIEADPFVDAVSFANGLRVSAWAAMNETRAALEAADEGTRVLDSLTGATGLADVSTGLLIEAGPRPGSHDYSLALAAANRHAQALAAKMRGREANAATRALPLLALEERGTCSRDWLQQVRENGEGGIVLLPAAGAEGELQEATG